MGNSRKKLQGETSAISSIEKILGERKRNKEHRKNVRRKVKIIMHLNL